MFRITDFEDAGDMHVPGETYIAYDKREYYIIITEYVRDGEFFELHLWYEIDLSATHRSHLGTPIQCWDEDEACNIIFEFCNALSEFEGENDVQQSDVIAVWEEFLAE